MSESNATDALATYEPPQVTELGKLVEVTAGLGVPNTNDAAGASV